MATAFISYSHRDEAFRQELEIHLAPLRRQNLLSIWHDRRITAGDALDGAISENLESADLILMLISADFVASEYCYAREMTRALERHDAKAARAISIICRPCDFNGLPFANFVLLPTDAKAVSSWTDRDAAWVDVVRGIRRALETATGTQKLQAPMNSGTDVRPRAAAERPRLPRHTTDLQKDSFSRNAMRDVGRFFQKSSTCWRCVILRGKANSGKSTQTGSPAKFIWTRRKWDHVPYFRVAWSRERFTIHRA
jgi:hypothetical protein